MSGHDEIDPLFPKAVYGDDLKCGHDAPAIPPRDAKGQEQLLSFFRYSLARLIDDADRCGVVLTIECVPRQPLAMGNYAMVPGVRSKR
jgi:hypothetical protein